MTVIGYFDDTFLVVIMVTDLTFYTLKVVVNAFRTPVAISDLLKHAEEHDSAVVTEGGRLVAVHSEAMRPNV